MAGALIGALRVTLGLDASYFEEGTKGATRAARKLEKDLAATGRSLSAAGQSLTLGITAPLTALAVESVKAAMESKDALAQVTNTLQTMGDAAGFTAEQLQEMAAANMAESLYDDDEILRRVTNTMLTFGKVADEEFARAQLAALDLSAKFGKDLQASAVMVGKALNDPVKGVTALQRVGISFSAQQKEQIKDMVEMGRVTDAQRLILAELERQVSGSAKAAADANPFTKLKHSWEEFKEEVGAELLDMLPAITDAIKSVMSAFNEMSPGMQKAVVIGGLLAAALGPLLMAFGAVVSILATMAPLLVSFGAQVASVVSATGAGAGVVSSLGAALGLILRFLGPIGIVLGLVYAAWKNWDDIAPILQELWANVSAALGPPFMAMVDAVKGALTDLWEGPFGDLLRAVLPLLAEFAKVLGSALGQYAIHILENLAGAVGNVFTALAGFVNMVAALLQGDWAGAWEGAKDLVVGVVGAILRVLEALLPGAISALRRLYTGVKEWLGEKIMGVFNTLIGGIEAVTGAFYNMYDRVVGHSYVPDMVAGIAESFARLDAVMVDQAKKTTKDTTELFRDMAREVQGLFNELFPEAAALADYRRKLALIERAQRAGPASGGITRDEADAARIRLARQNSEALWSERDRENQRILDMLDTEPIGRIDNLDDRLNHLSESLAKAANDTEDKTAKIITSFAEMGRDVVGSLRNMTQSFKSGDILGGIQSVLDMIIQVVDLTRMVQGKPRLGNSQHNAPGFSTGGSFRVGGSGGVDSKLVQFRATPGEMVDVRRPGALRPANDVVVVSVDKSDLFDTHVSRVAAPLADQAAMRGAMGGAAKARVDSARVRRNALG